jgi:hypothetical protein
MSRFVPAVSPFYINLPKEFAMTRFVQTPANFPRMTVSNALARPVPDSQEASRPLAGMLLAAVLAALLVAADQVINSWVDGHLLAGWVALWTITFATLAMLAPPLRKLTGRLAVVLSGWMQERAVQRQEEALWEMARHDHRVMAEIRVAMQRDQAP